MTNSSPLMRPILLVGAIVIAALFGCSGESTAPPTLDDSSDPPASEKPADSQPVGDADISEPTAIEPQVAVSDPAPPEPASEPEALQPTPEPAPAAPEPPIETDSTPETVTALTEPESVAATESPLEQQLAVLVVPPPWLEDVTSSYDTSQPWKEARLEIRRLFGVGQPETHREALKLMWVYHQKDDMGDHHEYPMYTFLGGEPAWSVLAHREYLAQPHENTPIHAYTTLASIYAQFGEFESARAALDEAMQGLPKPPWRIMQEANLMAAYGQLYADWRQPEEAKRYFAQAETLYPTAKPPYGGHLLKRRAADARAKLDLLTIQSLATTQLRDGQYRDKALGYAGDINLTVQIQAGKIADIQLTHEEKIDQNACVIIPQRIVEQQSLLVDGISGATVTKNAIVTGVYRCLQAAGLK